MKIDRLIAADGPQPRGNYSQATEIEDFDRLVYISGQIPVSSDGSVPQEFTAQCNRAWDNIEAQLKTANLNIENLIKVTVFLSDREFARENSRVRRERLGEVEPSLTVIITDIFDPDWLLEIEAIAAA